MYHTVPYISLIIVQKVSIDMAIGIGVSKPTVVYVDFTEVLWNQ